MSSALECAARTNTAPTLLQSWFRRLVLRQMTQLVDGGLQIQEAGATQSFGEASDLQATLRIHYPRFYRHAALGGSLGVAESYLQGDWDCDDLTSLFRIFIRNGHSKQQLDSGAARLTRWGHAKFHRWRANSRRGSRRNIAAHYDLGNDFYRLWLDPTLAYSCGLFRDSQTSLEAASVAKFDRICQLLQLSAHDHLVEIGTGWGGFALHAAQNYGCQITTTTISEQQYVVARDRIAAAGLTSKITLLKTDYRDLEGQYDKLASIEMIEAVGHEYLDEYFRKCSSLLRPDGACAIQGIVMPERGYQKYLGSVDFIQKYIFPGGCLPSQGSILDSVARATDLQFVESRDFSAHYAETLRRWRRGFLENLKDVQRLGYPEEFQRLWLYYLCYCEAAFEERSVGLLQMHFLKPKSPGVGVRLTAG